MQPFLSQSDECILGIDLGATFVRAARVDSCGGEFFSARTPSFTEAEEVIRSLVSKACRGMKVRALGLSRAPAIDSQGCISSWPSQPQWTGRPLINWLEKYASITVSADDGVCAALWEHRSRARVAPGAVTASVSIGTGLAIGISRGMEALPTGDGADTLAHERFGALDFPCRCGKDGCLQTVLSVQGLERLKAQGRIGRLCRAFYEFACALRARYKVDLMVITGGGVDRFGPSFLQRTLITSALAGGVNFQISRTPALSGIGGALLLAVDQTEKRRRWTARVREFIFQESKRLLVPANAIEQPVSV